MSDHIAWKGLNRMPQFVIQEHWARTHHFDLRLEKEGVLKSWALPKGMPVDDEKRLAIQVEDHDLDYGQFEGEIPPGEYGAGKVAIWDKGRYDPVEWTGDKILFVLHGERLKGRYVLIRLKRSAPDHWLIRKID
ncbi:DNA polymerase ligase N-terminal domain-containing protein [Candidatus Methylacidiphilum infernorum]|uniref:ATP-dependent DNA ligase n=1 Tax=Methylacidiphilum infernorum (isolate V4) TaxID=481448 RepID=B3E0H2_METI4|nr:DNA polymerase ligase N-terminal domain-containing protein [Candidatus Methylacidiphilum infernorum]ACD84401.1 ATP-dependent DNA ligase [Methylacidiphilum infernorum V4]